MTQHCFASISDTGLHCSWCITKNIIQNGVKLSQAFCEKHNMPCEELNYYCHSFIGYKPDYRMTDNEEQELRKELQRKQSQL